MFSEDGIGEANKRVIRKELKRDLHWLTQQNFERKDVSGASGDSVSNINVMECRSMSFLPCILCRNKLQKRTDKHGKPYFICDPCGIQFFVRRKQGIERLETLLRASEKNAVILDHATQRVFEIQAFLTEIDGTKAQIKTLDEEIGLFFQDEDKIRARNALKIKLDKLLENFEKCCANTRA